MKKIVILIVLTVFAVAGATANPFLGKWKITIQETPFGEEEEHSIVFWEFNKRGTMKMLDGDDLNKESKYAVDEKWNLLTIINAGEEPATVRYSFIDNDTFQIFIYEIPEEETTGTTENGGELDEALNEFVKQMLEMMKLMPMAVGERIK